MNDALTHKECTAKEKVFISEYLKVRCATTAYKAAYSWKNMKTPTIHQCAFQVLARPHVKVEVDRELSKRFQRNHTTIDEVLSIMADVIRADPKDAFKKDGTLKALKDMPRGLRQALAGFETITLAGDMFGNGKSVVTKVKFTPKAALIDMFMKHFGAYKNVLTIDNKIPISEVISAEEAQVIDSKLDEQY